MSAPSTRLRSAARLSPFAELVRLAGRRPTAQEARTWVVAAPMVFVDHRRDVQVVYTLEEGFLTDLASVPWFVSWMIDPLSWPWVDAGVVHDAGYAVLAPDRATADRWFRDVARGEYGDGQAGAWAAWVAWVALRLFGLPAWRNNRARLAAEGPRWRSLRPHDDREVPCRA